MRDPLRPIPVPSTSSFWNTSAPPPSQAGGTRSVRYDPISLIRDREGDSLGLDRRMGRRGEARQDPLPDAEARGQALVRASHEAIEGILGLCTNAGWAIVRILSVSPQGLLVRHVDALDRDLGPSTRILIGKALRSLSPVLGAPTRELARGGSSPLANVGTHLLGARVVADASSWTHSASAHGRAQEDLQISLVVPPRANGGAVQSVKNAAHLPRFEGHLAPLNDPDPRVLALALERRALHALRFQLRGHRAS